MRNATQQKKIREDMLPVLINNAYAFLKSALEKLEDDTKSSVINFYSAVELFLKAPLLHEHWTLIVSKDPKFSKFQKGDFISIGFKESIKRLKDILGIHIKNDAYNAFDKVRQHRNKYVHFFIQNENDIIAQIAKEQILAWAYLHHLIKNKLSHIFYNFEEKNKLIESSLKRHKKFWQQYSQLRYKQLLYYYENKINKGAIISHCSRCKVRSLEETIYSEVYTESHCRICQYYGKNLKLACPGCQRQTILWGDAYSSCEHCPYQFEPDKVFDIINTYGNLNELNEPVEWLIPANCHYCEGYQTVCELNEHYLCTNCFILTSTVDYCEYCSDSTNMADPADTYAFGCGFCDGAIGNANY